MTDKISRRNLGTAALGAAVAVGVIGGVTGGQALVPSAEGDPPDYIPFRSGIHQSGITTPAQQNAVFASFDVTAKATPQSLRKMLSNWTTACDDMVHGSLITVHTPGTDSDSPNDTAEVIDQNPGNLTITIGYGSTLFTAAHGLASRKPARLIDIPAFTGEMIDSRISYGDIAIQACADDPQIAYHVIRNLTRLGTGVVTARWMQAGFGRTSSTSPAQATPRNLMGFKDGTRNIRSNETTALTDFVWADSTSKQDWMIGGSYLVTRKIEMRLVKWDSDGLDDQEATFGRHKVSGAAFAPKNATEFTTPDFNAVDSSGALVIPPTAHVRLVAFEQNNGLRILRRGYNFMDGVSEKGTLSGGLFFAAYMRDPQQFVDLQTKLVAHDDLNEYTYHIASAVFAVPRGLKSNQDWGSQLFG
jgi:deferrochelatase/peroxidase EfeB